MRILTYNIHKGIGGRDRRYRFGRILAVIEAENPDIVCLQEVDRNVRRSRFHDQPQLLADYFGNLERIYQMNVRLREGWVRKPAPLALAAEVASSHLAAARGAAKPRGAQLAVIETPEGLLAIR